MKKLLIFLLAACLMTGTALASETFDGVVIAGQAVTITAPYGGTVESVDVRQGQMLQAGQEIITLSTTKVLASQDGTIQGVFADVGDDASGTVMYLAPVSKYTIRATIAKAASTAETKYVTLGEEVYIRCTKDGSHQARGVITAVDGSSYTVETNAGELYMEETVSIYRTADYASSCCIGNGSVSRTEAIALKSTGSVLRLHVQDGDTVERGQLLFETVDGIITEDVITDSTVRTSLSGVAADIQVKAGQKVSQGDVLLTLYQPQDYQIRFSIPEDMLSLVSTGDKVTLSFNWNEDAAPLSGTITEISYVGSTSQSGETTYDGYVAFTADESIRLGMTAIVTLE